VWSQLEIERYFDLQAQTARGAGAGPPTSSALKKLLLARIVREAAALGLERQGPFGMLAGRRGARGWHLAGAPPRPAAGADGRTGVIRRAGAPVARQWASAGFGGWRRGR
jgi:hypothetical protein